MYATSSLTAPRIGNHKLSSSYPNIKPIFSKDFLYNDLLSFGQPRLFTKSWNVSHDNRSHYNSRNGDAPNNSDLQPLTWLQKQSIIDIVPLDAEEEFHDNNHSSGPNVIIDNDLDNSQPREELETQENSNIQDFVRFQAQRNNLGHHRVALRQNNTFCPDVSHNYSYKVNGHTKPNFSYTQLIFMAIETCKDRAMTVNDIYQWCEINYPYYKHIGPSWKNSLRHNLSINKSFRRMPREGQQGGPGRGAYWIVEDKERKTLLESIFRSQQAMPLIDRNDSTIVVNSTKNGPLLCIDGRFTDANTYLQTRICPEDKIIVDNGQHRVLTPPPTSDDSSNLKTEDDIENDYASMMRGLTANSIQEEMEVTTKLSNSHNSFLSRPENTDSTDSAAPRLKNRRKTTHEKVRSYADPDLASSSPAAPCSSPPLPNLTSVNVVVAPHFDHIYARYQQFLPPAIPSNMDCHAVGDHGDNNDHDNQDEEFLKGGHHHVSDDNDNDSTNGNDVDDDNEEIKVEETVQQSPPIGIKRPLSHSNSASKRVCSPIVKEEMVEPTPEAHIHEDGYDTDSTVPMTLRGLRRSSRVLATAATKARGSFTKGHRASMKLKPGSQRRYRHPTRRTRNLRIDKSSELSAIRILASLERRQQHVRNIDNLYRLNNFLNIAEPAAQQPSPA